MRTYVMDEMPVGRFSLVRNGKVVLNARVGDKVGDIIYDLVVANPADIVRVVTDIEREKN